MQGARPIRSEYPLWVLNRLSSDIWSLQADGQTQRERHPPAQPGSTLREQDHSFAASWPTNTRLRTRGREWDKCNISSGHRELNRERAWGGAASASLAPCV